MNHGMRPLPTPKGQQSLAGDAAHRASPPESEQEILLSPEGTTGFSKIEMKTMKNVATLLRSTRDIRVRFQCKIKTE